MPSDQQTPSEPVVSQSSKALAGDALTVIFGFSSLGIWRKIYVLLCLLTLNCVPLLYILGLAFGESYGDIHIGVSAAIILLPVLYSVWVYQAVSQRKVLQLRLLALTQLIPFLNPVTAILFWLISSQSKKEQQV